MAAEDQATAITPLTDHHITLTIHMVDITTVDSILDLRLVVFSAIIITTMDMVITDMEGMEDTTTATISITEVELASSSLPSFLFHSASVQFLVAEDRELFTIITTELKVVLFLADQAMMIEKDKQRLERQDLDQCLLTVLKAIQ